MSNARRHPRLDVEIEPYDPGITMHGEASMPGKKKVITPQEELFGRRLARLRKEAGYSQRSLAAEIGVSYRVIAYYEAQTTHPPTHLLPAIADALSLSIDQLLGREAVRPRKAPQNERLIRQLRQVEKLPSRARQSVIEHIEGLVAKYGSGG